MKRLVVIWFMLCTFDIYASESLTGVWSGYYRCSNTPIRLDLVLDQQDAQLQGLFLFYLSSGDTPSGAYTLSGQLNEDAGTLVLKPGEWQKRPIGFTAVGLSGQYEADQITGTISFNQCGSFQVAKDLERTEQLLAQVERSERLWEKAPTALAEAENETQECIAVAKWASKLKAEYPDLDMSHTPLNQIFQKAAPLFSDSDFKPVWGQSYTEYSKDERKRVYYDILSPCLKRRELSGYFKGYSHIVTRPFIMERGEFSHSEVVLRAQIIAQQRQWLHDKLTDLSRLPASEAGFASWEQIRADSDQQLSDIWPSEREGFEQGLAQTLARLAPEVLTGRVNRAVAEAADFTAISQLGRLLKENRLLVDSVPHEQLVLHKNIIARRQDQLIESEVSRDLEALSSISPDLNGLAQSTEWFRAFKSKYKALDGPSISKARQEFRFQRRSLLKNTKSQLIQNVNDVDSVTGLDQLVAIYIGLPSDRNESTLGTVWNSIDQRRQQLLSKQEKAALNSTYCERFRGHEEAIKEPSDRDVCDALATTIDEMNAAYKELGRKCRAREFGNNPILATQCMSLCVASQGRCNLSFKMTHFENLDCAAAQGEPGWICDYYVKFSGSDALMKEVLSIIAPNGGLGQGRFINAQDHWIHVR
ncbi:hypothetical protein [Marinobacter lipolyticus]|uniref:hypothetical protein n=1 Tax=Marinobacter lipolyticus TaxID=209639 RepID=UPI003A945A79